MKCKVDKDGKVIIPESVVKSQVITHLISRGYRCPEDFGIVNTTGVYNEKKGCWMSNPRRFLGAPDIQGFTYKYGIGGKYLYHPQCAKDLAVIRGFGTHGVHYGFLGKTMFAIETKRGKGGKLSTDQIRWRDNFIESGLLYVLATDVGDVMKAGL